jgi:FMN phosphatase YigB (HAD superfamily)
MRGRRAVPTALSRGVRFGSAMPRTFSGIEAVLFGVGGTLIDTRDFSGWAELIQAQGIDLDAQALSEAHQESVRTGLVAGATQEEYLATILSTATRREVAADIVDRILLALRSQPLRGALFSDARLCLQRLSRDHRRLGIVSNSRSEEDLRDLLRRLGILSWFGVVVSSGTEHLRKPDPEIFRRAIARIDVDGHSAAFVGDDPLNDVEGARRAGLRPIWLNRDGTGHGLDPPEVTSLS